MKRILQSLYESEYLQARYVNEAHLADVTLLKNGRIFSNQLLNQWKELSPTSKRSDIKDVSVTTNIIGRLKFIHSKEFKENCQNLLGSNAITLGGNTAIYRSVLSCPTHNGEGDVFVNKSPTTIRLISDNFIHAFRGLDNFYSIQRERKIWWMRFSADPSRYFVEPYNLSNEDAGGIVDSNGDCQSVTVKSNIFNNTVDMETITLIRLNGLLQDVTNIPVAVIRSVIDLCLTTYALLFDAGSQNGRVVLRLNRKLAPYQCALASFVHGTPNSELHELSLHLNFVLCRAGLRLFEIPFHATSKENIDLFLRKADSYGIPYTIIVEENSLKTGLMKLRNRDTSLAETIHISDLPIYLQKICE
ncbi:DNA polymerase subunit gamma-2, mitochondrial [Haematobia irritans]|uniref:DNA polymerase subunit gamma-2, mitochondrial n=1 Tax=Haematobia irritans TaxID=7368 RepID=UPI003F50A732